MGEQGECTNWSTVEKKMVAAKPWFEEQRTLLEEILRKSDARLSPLSDPLRVDLGSHRWLREERETAYSDWLAWVITQLPTSESLFFLFAQPRERLGSGKVDDYKKNGWLGVEAKLGAASKCTLYSGLYWNSDKTLGGRLFVMSESGD